MSSLLTQISDKAKANFADIPFPHRKDEYWRFADLNSWNVDALFPFFSGNVEKGQACQKIRDIEKSLSSKNSVVIFDGQILFADLPEGIEVLSMSSAADLYPEKVSKFFADSKGKFDTFASSRPNAGAYIKIKKGAIVTLNLGVISKLSLSSNSIFVDIDDNAQLNLCRRYLTFGGSFGISKTGFALGENSKLELSTVKFSEEKSLSYLRDDFVPKSGAVIIDAFAEAGISPSRNERNFEISAKAVDIDSREFALIKGNITHDIRTNQIHKIGGSHSNLSVKAVIDDTAKLAFSGLIRVDEQAQKTRSYQSCKSLLLSKTAKSQASPILEILANDVECSHGCAVSNPDYEELFYMLQRGLTKSDSLKLMTRSFAETTFEKLSDADLRESIIDSIF